MAYLPTHAFETYQDDEPHPEDLPYCGMPRGDKGICAHHADHPIHAMGRPEVERIARALFGKQWRSASDPVDLRRMSEHRNHDYSADCALCRQDVHAIAAAVLDIQAGR